LPAPWIAGYGGRGRYLGERSAWYDNLTTIRTFQTVPACRFFADGRMLRLFVLYAWDGRRKHRRTPYRWAGRAGQPVLGLSHRGDGAGSIESLAAFKNKPRRSGNRWRRRVDPPVGARGGPATAPLLNYCAGDRRATRRAGTGSGSITARRGGRTSVGLMIYKLGYFV